MLRDIFTIYGVVGSNEYISFDAMAKQTSIHIDTYFYSQTPNPAFEGPMIINFHTGLNYLNWVSIMKGGSGDRDQPKLSMQAPDRRMPAPQPSAFQQPQTGLQPPPQQQQSSPGTPGPNLQAEAEPLYEARNLNTPETEPHNEISDDMVIDSEHSDQYDTEQPDDYSQAMERLRQTQDRMEQPRDDETGLHSAGNSDDPDPINA